MAETTTAVKGRQLSIADKLVNIIKQVEVETMQRRVVVRYDAEFSNNLVASLRKKHPELAKFSSAQIKGALKYLLRELTIEALNKEGLA